MTKDEFLKRVSKVDPAAAKKLKEMHKKVARNHQYAEKINFIPTNNEDNAAAEVYKLFL